MLNASAARTVERFLINHKFLMRAIPYPACCIFILITQISAVVAAGSDNNPLMNESTLPYHVPPFDKIKDEHFTPAMEAGMRDQLKEVEVVANNSEKPTFENTVIALERTGRLLDRAERTKATRQPNTCRHHFSIRRGIN